MELTLSSLSHTWILDLDGTIVEHNGYKKYGHDVLLPGVKNFFKSIPAEDKIVFLTSRKKEYADITESFLRSNEIQYDYILYDMPYGERILMNDNKPSGLQTGYVFNLRRDNGIDCNIVIDERL